jgi:hypothetical protein
VAWWYEVLFKVGPLVWRGGVLFPVAALAGVAAPRWCSW